MVLCSLLLLLVLVCGFNGEHDILKRRIVNTNCDPSQDCVKGDLIALNIANCVRRFSLLISCSWKANSGDPCIPQPVEEGLKFRCSDPGTNTRCVCRDGIRIQKCRCQYWPEDGSTNNIDCKYSSKQCEQICNMDKIFCWKKFECLKGCCADNVTGTRKKSLTFCGDGSCNGNEQPGSCPIDCCYQINSTCVNDTRVCTPTCCQMQQCCSESKPTGDSGGLNGGKIAGIVVGVLITMVVLVIIVTFLLYKKYIRHRDDNYERVQQPNQSKQSIAANLYEFNNESKSYKKLIQQQNNRKC